MRALLPLLFLVAGPFWETKPPETWTMEEVDIVLKSSPWVAALGGSPELQAYFATAAPIEMAEGERRKRMKGPAPDPDYADYLRENRENAFVLAIPYPKIAGASKGDEDKRLEEQSVMKIGHKAYKILGHFPPTPSDPVLRLIFPRVVKPTDKSIEFELYLPNLSFPERSVSFFVKDLMFRGNLEM